MVERVCLQCGIGFHAHPADIRKGGGKYCSRACYLKATNKPRISRICEHCGREFSAKHSEVKRGGGRFCSSKCAYAAMTGENSARWSGRTALRCLECGDEILVTPSDSDAKWCSMACRAAWMQQHMKGENNPNWKGGSVKKICAVCGKKFEVYPCLADERKCCSLECAGILKKRTGSVAGVNCAHWKGGKSFEPYSPAFRSSLKEAIRKRDGYTCQLCGRTQEKNGSLLAIHHIDYDKRNCSSTNLLSLCRSCHSKTNYNREGWTAFFTARMDLLAVAD